MTREEAKLVDASDDVFYKHIRRIVNELIDTVYDDFETRTCENCKYYGSEFYHITHPNHRDCTNRDSFTFLQEPHFTDGCNKFERKQND